MLSDNEVNHFIKIAKEVLDINLSYNEALEQGIKLLCLLDLVVKEFERSDDEEPKSKE